MQGGTHSFLSNPQAPAWNAKLYDAKHIFVSEYATDLLNLLNPKLDDRIFDLGCGTGHLTARIAASGARLVGGDSSPAMLDRARALYPALEFTLVDGENLPFDNEFDAVFSNAALHWMKQPEKVAAGIARSLKPGGRFVAELGGKGNIAQMRRALDRALEKEGLPASHIDSPWYFPSIGEYTSILEKYGLCVTFAVLFDRPTSLSDGDRGMRNWFTMFANYFFRELSDTQRDRVLSDIENQLRPTLYENGTWIADYKRLRVVAVKPSS